MPHLDPCEPFLGSWRFPPSIILLLPPSPTPQLPSPRRPLSSSSSCCLLPPITLVVHSLSLPYCDLFNSSYFWAEVEKVDHGPSDKAREQLPAP